MNMSKTEVFVITSAIEHLYLNKKQCSLNESGIKKLAEIQSKFAEFILLVNAEDVVNRFEKLMLKEINYSGKTK